MVWFKQTVLFHSTFGVMFLIHNRNCNISRFCKLVVAQVQLLTKRNHTNSMNNHNMCLKLVLLLHYYNPDLWETERQLTIANFAIYDFIVFIITFRSCIKNKRRATCHTPAIMNGPIGWWSLRVLTLVVPCHKQCMVTLAPSCVCAMYTTASLIDSIISWK